MAVVSPNTLAVPEHMLTVGGRSILGHIMRTFAHYGHKDFFVTLGYKAKFVKDYFLHYRSLNANFTVNLETGGLKF